MRIGIWTIAATAACALVPVAATATQISDDQEILITGESRKQAQRQAQLYVRQLGVANGEKQAARWLSHICPRAIGLSKVHAAMVEQRIRKIAEAADAPLATEKCRGNLIVVFTDDGKGVVSKISSLDGSPEQFLSAHDAKKLKTGQGPVRWWYDIGTQTRDGVGSMSMTPPGAAFTDQGGNRAEVPSNADTTILAQYNSSLVSTQAVRSIKLATVVVDVNDAEGRSLASIIDYAAMVGLAEIRLGAAPDGSILALFKPQPVTALSNRDEAFLKSLYRITMDRSANQQQRTLVNSMVERRTDVQTQ